MTALRSCLTRFSLRAKPKRTPPSFDFTSQDLADAAADGMEQLVPVQLVDLLVALADLQMHPGDDWLDLHEQRCNESISHLTAYQVSDSPLDVAPFKLSHPS